MSAATANRPGSLHECEPKQVIQPMVWQRGQAVRGLFGVLGARRCVGCDSVEQPQIQKSSATSEGTQRKLHTLEAAQIPVWQIAYDPLPDAANLREMVLPELEAAHEHSVQHAASPESVWQATQFEPRRPASAFEPSPATAAKTAPVREAEPAKADRWDQAWPSEEARSSEFLDEFGMIELPPLVVKGSGRSATGFTRG